MLNVKIDDSIHEVFQNAGHSLDDMILAMAEGRPTEGQQTAPSAFALFYSAYQEYLDSERQRLLDNIKHYEFQQDMCSYRISIYSHFLEKQRSIDFQTKERDSENGKRDLGNFDIEIYNTIITQRREEQRNLTEFTERALEKWVPVFERDNLDPETEEGRLFLETIRASYDRICEEQLALLETTHELKKASDFESALKTLEANFEHLTAKKTECTTRYQELGLELSEHCERRTLALSNLLGPMLETKTAEEQAVFYREFINTYISPSLEDTEGKTLLHKALDARNSSALKQLLQVGANPFQKPAAEGGLSPLAYAIQLAEEMDNPIFLLIILKRLRERPMAHKEHYLPDKGQAPFYKRKPFYDFPSIERDVAQPAGITDEEYQEQQKQIEKNVVGWFIFSEMKEFLDARIEYYANRHFGLSLGTDPIKRLTQLAALYQRLYDCLTNNPEGIFDLNLQFDAFRKLLITMEQKELSNDKPKANTFFDVCVHANNVTEGRIQSYQMILLDPSQSIFDVLEKGRGQLERELTLRETSLKQLELRYDSLGQKYSDAHAITDSIITDILIQYDVDMNIDSGHSLSEVLESPDLGKKLTCVSEAVGIKYQELKTVKTQTVPGLEAKLFERNDEVDGLLAERREQGNVIEQQKETLEQQKETLEQQKRDLSTQQEIIRRQQDAMERLLARIAASENTSNNSNTTNNTTNSNEEQGGYRPSHF